MAMESEPSIAASQTRIARSAPFARHLRSDSSTSSDPTETVTTSTGSAAPSLIFTASSSEKSSHSFKSRMRKSGSISRPSSRIAKSSCRHLFGAEHRYGFANEFYEFLDHEFALVACGFERVLEHGEILRAADHVDLEPRNRRRFFHPILCRLFGADRVGDPDPAAA